jgi:hypothetical protein
MIRILLQSLLDGDEIFSQSKAAIVQYLGHSNVYIYEVRHLQYMLKNYSKTTIIGCKIWS